MIGEATQDAITNHIFFQFTAALPPYANENPTIAPIIEWVVETGNLK